MVVFWGTLLLPGIKLQGGEKLPMTFQGEKDHDKKQTAGTELRMPNVNFRTSSHITFLEYIFQETQGQQVSLP